MLIPPRHFILFDVLKSGYAIVFGNRKHSLWSIVFIPGQKHSSSCICRVFISSHDGKVKLVNQCMGDFMVQGEAQLPA